MRALIALSPHITTSTHALLILHPVRVIHDQDTYVVFRLSCIQRVTVTAPIKLNLNKSVAAETQPHIAMGSELYSCIYMPQGHPHWS